jgi:hypothetical protein
MASRMLATNAASARRQTYTTLAGTKEVRLNRVGRRRRGGGRGGKFMHGYVLA